MTEPGYTVDIYDETRVFFQIGNYQFEVVVPPIIAGSEGAARTADLLREQLASLTAGEP